MLRTSLIDCPASVGGHAQAKCWRIRKLPNAGSFTIQSSPPVRQPFGPAANQACAPLRLAGAATAPQQDPCQIGRKLRLCTVLHNSCNSYNKLTAVVTVFSPPAGRGLLSRRTT